MLRTYGSFRSRRFRKKRYFSLFGISVSSDLCFLWLSCQWVISICSDIHMWDSICVLGQHLLTADKPTLFFNRPESLGNYAMVSAFDLPYSWCMQVGMLPMPRIIYSYQLTAKMASCPMKCMVYLYRNERKVAVQTRVWEYYDLLEIHNHNKYTLKYNNNNNNNIT